MSETYFRGINYSMANEDTTVEYKMMESLKPKRILSVCGSGGRALPLIHDQSEELICVDLSEEQLLLLELRKETILRLDFPDFLKFWGYPPYFVERYTEDRQEMFSRLELSEEARQFFTDLFNSLKWQGLLYVGKWEQTFITLSKITKPILRKHAEKIFRFQNLSDQVKYLKSEFPQQRWKFLLTMLGNRTLFNALLYKGSFVKKNIPKSYRKFYIETFDHLLHADVARNNFFLQLCLLGEVKFEEGRTIEGQIEAFNRVKKNLVSKTRVIPEKGDLIETIEKYQNLDFISMSDVPSYFTGDLESQFLQRCRPHLSPKGVLVIRSYLHIPEADRSGFIDVTKDYQSLIEQEKVGVYHFEVLQKDESIGE